MTQARLYGYGILGLLMILIIVPESYLRAPVTLEALCILIVGSAICFSVDSFEKAGAP
jgi:hypothetical protein